MSAAVNRRMVETMLSNAGMDANAIAAAFAVLKPAASFDGAPYYDATKVSRYARRYLKGL
ncbi:hypothetical protein [Sphingomonas sp.]|uniref:hypothetical protein n=1 Tax=Sphingomonas sp. TaxID=28214 RepID=UPI0035A81D23